MVKEFDLTDGLQGREFLRNREQLKSLDVSSLEEKTLKSIEGQVKWIMNHFGGDKEKFVDHIKESGVDTAIFQIYSKSKGQYDGKIDGIYGPKTQLAINSLILSELIEEKIGEEHNDNGVAQESEQVVVEEQNQEQLRNEQEQQASIEHEIEQERLEQERLEQERLEQERLEQERLEQERLEQERLEQERLEQERLEQERLEQERLEQERLEQERLEQERLEQERLEQERLEQERLEQERFRQQEQLMNRDNADFGENPTDEEIARSTEGESEEDAIGEIMEQRRQEELERKRQEEERREQEIRREGGTIQYQRFYDFLRENTHYTQYFQGEIDAELVIKDKDSERIRLYTREGTLEFQEDGKIIVEFSSDPNDRPAIVDVSSVMPLNNETLSQIVRLVRAFGKLAPSREYNYQNLGGTHNFIHDDGYIKITERVDNSLLYEEYDGDSCKIASQVLQYLDVGLSIERLPDGRLQRTEFIDGRTVFQDTYSIERDYNRNFRFEKTNGEPVMVLEDGTEIGLYNPDVHGTEDEYLNLLVEKLNTPYKLSTFFKELTRYVFDSPNPDDPEQEGYDRTSLGLGKSDGDYYRKPEEFIRRTDTRGYMLGDCDDYSGLAYEILSRQGKNVFQVLIPGHAVTVGLEKLPNGEYLVYSIGTFGLDINGVREPFSPNDTWQNYTTDDVTEGIKLVLAKYGEFDLRNVQPTQRANFWKTEKGDGFLVYSKSKNFVQDGNWSVGRDLQFVSTSDLLGEDWIDYLSRTLSEML